MIWDSGRTQVLTLAREKTNKLWKTQRDEGRGGDKSRAGMDRYFQTQLYYVFVLACILGFYMKTIALSLPIQEVTTSKDYEDSDTELKTEITSNKRVDGKESKRAGRIEKDRCRCSTKEKRVVVIPTLGAIC
jgi:hypothetical protein